MVSAGYADDIERRLAVVESTLRGVLREVREIREAVAKVRSEAEAGKAQLSLVLEAEGEEEVVESVDPTTEWAEKVYEAYPRKKARGRALEKIRRALTDLAEKQGLSKEQAGRWMVARVERYAESVRGMEIQFVPHPSTWFGQGRYWDEDEEIVDKPKSHGAGNEDYGWQW